MAKDYEGKDYSQKMHASCPCGSGEPYGACCGKEEFCSCGSGRAAGECCFAPRDEEENGE